MSEQTFIISSCTSTYGVLLCVKFNKKKILWTVLKGCKVYGRAGAGIDMRNISTNFGWSNTSTFWIYSGKVYTATVTRDVTKIIEGGGEILFFNFLPNLYNYFMHIYIWCTPLCKV
jgi:hypothetical protein